MYSFFVNRCIEDASADNGTSNVIWTKPKNTGYRFSFLKENNKDLYSKREFRGSIRFEWHKTNKFPFEISNYDKYKFWVK